MEPTITFAHAESVLPFVYVFLKSIFLGTNIVGFIVGKFATKKIEIDQSNVDFVFSIINLLGILMLVVIFLTFISGFFLIKQNLAFITDPMLEAIVFTRISIFFFIVINVFYICFLYKKALNARKIGDFLAVRENFVIILRYFVPLNFIFSTFSMFLGVNLRMFSC